MSNTTSDEMNASFTARVTIILLAAAVLAAIVPTVQLTRAAGPWYVAPGGNDGNACISPGAPCATINGAIGKASSGDAILIAAGIYTGTGDQVVLLDKSVALSGGWNGSFDVQNSTSTIDAGKSRRGIKVNSGVDGTVDRFTIIRGNAVQDGVGENGAGIYNDGSLAVNNSQLSENHTRLARQRHFQHRSIDFEPRHGCQQHYPHPRRLCDR